MIERYTRPEIGAVWSEQRKLDCWLVVELAAVDVLAEMGVVPADDAADCAWVRREDIEAGKYPTFPTLLPLFDLALQASVNNRP